MARGNSFGKMLIISTAAAVAGGVLAYLKRKELEGMVQDIADALDAQPEDGAYSVDLGDEPVFHKVPVNEEPAPEAEAAQEAPAAEESDFVEEGAPAAETEPAPEAEPAPESAQETTEA